MGLSATMWRGPDLAHFNWTHIAVIFLLSLISIRRKQISLRRKSIFDGDLLTKPTAPREAHIRNVERRKQQRAVTAVEAKVADRIVARFVAKE
jgi:hypothetical protein